jgi:hypothetical protein
MKRTFKQGNLHRRRHMRATGRSSGAAHIIGNAVFVLLGLSALGLIAVLGVTLAQLPAGSAAQAPAPGDKGIWIPIRSSRAADLLAAARQSTLFTQNRSEAGDHVADLSRLGTPVFVHPLRRVSSTHETLPDFYVIPILNARGETTDAAELELNPAHSAIHVIAIVTYTQPRPSGTIAQVTPQAAVASVATRHHATQRSGAQPQLVYFPLDAEQQQTGKLVWTSGGESPADPVWLIQGSDGQDHIAGNDGAVYFSSQIPLS